MNFSSFQPNIKPITNFSQEDTSYANSVLQSICCLNFAHKFNSYFNDHLKIKDDINYLLTNNLYKIISGKVSNSLKIIDNFRNKYKDYKSNIKSENVLKEDPFHFLYYLLQFIHFENNKINNPKYDINILYNQPLEKKKEEKYMHDLFLDFFHDTQNSIISKNIYILVKHTYNCSNCGQYYSFSFSTILKINLDNAKIYKDQQLLNNYDNNLSLGDALQYYFSPKKIKCNNCKNNNVDEYKNILISQELLIIVFERHNNFYINIKFYEILDVNFYSLQNNSSIELNNKFKLKSCIYYDRKSKKYLSFCLLNNGIWHKYSDNKCEKIGSNISNISNINLEPKILFYEKIKNNSQNENYQTNQNNFYNNNQLNNYNQFNSNNNNNACWNNNINMNYNINNNSNMNNNFNMNNNINMNNNVNMNGNINVINNLNNIKNQFNFNNNNISNNLNENNIAVNNINNNIIFNKQNNISNSYDNNQCFQNPLLNINKESINNFNKMMNFQKASQSQKNMNNFN